MTLKSLYQYFGQHSESRWIMKPQNGMLLYQFITRHPIKRVLELGTGVGMSASLIALAMKDKGETDYHVDTVEQYDKCIDLANKLIPDEFKKNITIHKSEVEVWQTEKIPYQNFMNFKTVPEGEFQLVITDGPGPFLQGDYFIELPNGNAMKMLFEDKLKPGTFVIHDGRLEALRLLERYFAENFYLIEPENPGFNVLERKNNSVHYEDAKLKEITRMGYFKDAKL